MRVLVVLELGVTDFADVRAQQFDRRTALNARHRAAEVDAVGHWRAARFLLRGGFVLKEPELRACGVDIEKIKKDLTEFLDKDLAGLATDRAGDPKPTAGFQRVVQRAAIHVQSSGRDEVTGANVLVALFSERESHAVYFLQLQDMTRLDAVNFISHGIAKSPGKSAPRTPTGAVEPGEPDREEKSAPKRGQDALTTYCVNLNKKGAAGKIDPLIGREQEIERTIQILCRRTKNNPLYVGDPGVGKTAIAEGLAKRIVDGDVRTDERSAGGDRAIPGRRHRPAAAADLAGLCPPALRAPRGAAAPERDTPNAGAGHARRVRLGP